MLIGLEVYLVEELERREVRCAEVMEELGELAGVEGVMLVNHITYHTKP